MVHGCEANRLSNFCSIAMIQCLTIILSVYNAMVVRKNSSICCFFIRNNSISGYYAVVTCTTSMIIHHKVGLSRRFYAAMGIVGMYSITPYRAHCVLKKKILPQNEAFSNFKCFNLSFNVEQLTSNYGFM